MKEGPRRGMVGTGDWLSSANTLVTLRRLHSLALSFGTFAYAKDRCHPTIASLEVGYPALLPHDGLLKDNLPPVLISYCCSIGGQV